MEKSTKKTKRIKEDKKETPPVTDEYILEQQNIFMLETYLKPLLFPPKNELNEGVSTTSPENEQNRSFEIEDPVSSSAQQKCVNYANCKKKFPSTCCRRYHKNNQLTNSFTSNNYHAFYTLIATECALHVAARILQTIHALFIITSN